MAETLTIDTTPDSEVLTPDEQDSLEVGEKMQAEQENLLAGKYKNAEELESAYIELQSKLGAQEKKTEPEPTQEVETETEDKSDTTILDRLWEEAQTEVSKDTIKELSSMNPQDIAKMHLEYRAQNQQTPSITDEQVSQLKNVAGGDQEYTDMISWAKGALKEGEIEMYDAVMDKGDPLACYFAVQALKYRYDDASGVEGEMLTGKAPSNKGNQFQSQAQVVEAMSDPKYDNDPAYRQEVMKKLERSNIQF